MSVTVIENNQPAVEGEVPGAAPGATRGAGVSFARVSRRFGDLTVVDDISVDVAPGEFFTLLGASGSGKTTLLQLLAGFQDPDAGHVLLDGKVISGLPPFKRDIGIVFQSYALFPHLSVFENVAFALRIRKLSRRVVRERVNDALQLVHLADFGQRKISQLSGGQQQRVALARAIVYRPRLLLMDEPLSALDAKLRLAMQVEIKALHRELGVTIVYVTHDQREALSMSDRVAVLRQGHIEQVAPPADLYEQPATKYVADFIGEANVLAATVHEVRAGRITVNIAGSIVAARTEQPVRSGQALSIAVRPERVQLCRESVDGHTVQGKVVDSVYAGDHTLVYVEIDGSVEIGPPAIVRSQVSVRHGPPPGVGEPVYLRWHPDHTIVLLQ